MVGVTGFEPATIRPPVWYATKLRHTPIYLHRTCTYAKPQRVHLPVISHTPTRNHHTATAHARLRTATAHARLRTAITRPPHIHLRPSRNTHPMQRSPQHENLPVTVHVYSTSERRKFQELSALIFISTAHSNGLPHLPE